MWGCFRAEIMLVLRVFVTFLFCTNRQIEYPMCFRGKMYTEVFTRAFGFDMTTDINFILQENDFNFLVRKRHWCLCCFPITFSFGKAIILFCLIFHHKRSFFCANNFQRTKVDT